MQVIDLLFRQELNLRLHVIGDLARPIRWVHASDSRDPGLTSRELLSVLRATAGMNVIGADVVEVAPAYDHAQITGIAASHVIYELISAFATK